MKTRSSIRPVIVRMCDMKTDGKFKFRLCTTQGTNLYRNVERNVESNKRRRVNEVQTTEHMYHKLPMGPRAHRAQNGHVDKLSTS